MFKFIFIALLILASFSCQIQQFQKVDNSADNKVDSMSNSIVESKTSESNENINEIIESVTDDSKIGEPRKNKIELLLFGDSNNNIIELKFYSLNLKKWELKQTMRLDSGSLRLDPKFIDFNNDGYKDVTFVSALAGRGANELRTLLIYDKKADQLIYIKNSQEYPNLLYNKTLNCIDAQRFYGGTTVTEFLKLEGDMLKKFAYIETFGIERKVYLVDKNGKEKILRTDKVSEDSLFERYKTFNPPTEYTAEELVQ